MLDFKLEEIEIIKTLSKLGLDFEIKNEESKSSVLDKCEFILKEYYFEKTRGDKDEWANKFKKYGISEEEGKLVISYGRRIGMDFS